MEIRKLKLINKPTLLFNRKVNLFNSIFKPSLYALVG